MIAPSSLVQPQPSDAETSLDPSAVANLRSVIQGSVLQPDDDGYAEAVSCWSLGVRHTPVLAVLPETADDIARAVTFARYHNLPVAVQGTGHGTQRACTGGILINTLRMQGVTIDPEARTARVEPGVRWSSVIPLAQEHGLAPLSGSSSHVGVIGYTLGGGHGWLARKYGRAADRILAVDLVTADGEPCHVTPDTDPDLFWALHRDSGNFGIVTGLEFELIPVTEIYGGGVIYRIEDAARILPAFRNWARTLPEEITASISIMRFPPLPFLPPMLQGVACVIVRACAVGDLAAGEAIIAPMRSLGQPIMDTFGVMPFAAIDAISMDPTDPMPALSTTMILPALTDDLLDTLLQVAGPGVDSPLLMIDLRALGATLFREGDPAGPGADAFAFYAIGIAGSPDARTALQDALAELTAAIQPFASDRILMNFLGEGDFGDHRTRATYSDADYLRMQQVKATHDPGNRFRFNHNITPAQAGN